MRWWVLAVWMEVTGGALGQIPRPGAPLVVLAAESVYGDLARQIGAGDVSVSSVLTNPDQDPHLFEASPSIARRLAGAHIVILNGLGYDPWMERLLAGAPMPGRVVLSAGAGRSLGDNPHIWYDLGAMEALARAMADAFSALDPAHREDYAARMQGFTASLQPIQTRIVALRTRLAHTPVTATEPVFGYGLLALGMDVRNERFALSIMRDTEPAASDVAAFETDLKQRRVRLLIHNSQTAGPVAARMERIARAAHIPVVGVTETEPAGVGYQAWMLRNLEAIDHALP